MGFEINEEYDAVIKYYSIKVKEVKGEKVLAMDKSITLPMHADDLEMVKANKSTIIAYIESKKAYEEEQKRIRQEKIAGIPGLKTIREARADIDKWYHEFNNLFEGEYAVGGLGGRPKPEYDFDKMYEQYPLARAYLKAEAFANASHAHKRIAGKKAVDRILNDEDYTQVLLDMEAEWKAYCEDHVWD